MSQITKVLTSGGPIPPIIPTSFQTQDGTAVPAANILIVNGIDSPENNDNGIIAKGGVAGTTVANEVDIVLTNRVTGTNSTVGVQTVTVLSFDTSVVNLPGIYDLAIKVQAMDVTTPSGAAYEILGALIARADLTLATIGTPSISVNGSISYSVADVSVSFVGGIIEVEVTGLVGKNITWSGLLTYTFGGA